MSERFSLATSACRGRAALTVARRQCARCRQRWQEEAGPGQRKVAQRAAETERPRRRGGLWAPPSVGHCGKSIKSRAATAIGRSDTAYAAARIHAA
jgi:hypothetical protein